MEVIGCDDTGQVRKVHFYAHSNCFFGPFGKKMPAFSSDQCKVHREKKLFNGTE